MRLAHLQRERKNCNLQINLEKTVMLRLSRKEKNTHDENKQQPDKTRQHVYLPGNMAEKTSEVQN
jgi:hypothetical protein